MTDIAIPGLTEEAAAALNANFAYVLAAASGMPQTGGDMLGALGFVDGTAAAPGLYLATSPDTGIYKSGTSSASRGAGFGVSSGGVGIFSLISWDVLGVGLRDGAVLGLGRSGQSFSTGEAYLGSMYTPSANVSGAGGAVISWNIANGGVRATDTVTKTALSAVGELDKLDLWGDGGAVTFNAAAGWRIRGPLAHTNVTLLDNYNLTFTIPNASDVQGSHTRTTMIHIPQVGGGAAPSIYSGIRFASGYNFSLNTDAGVPLTFGIAGVSTMTLDANGINVYQSAGNVNGVGLLPVTTGNSPYVTAAGVATNIGLIIAAKGSGGLFLGNGATIGADFSGAISNQWSFLTPINTLTSASGGAGFRLAHGAAPSAPVNGDMWTETTGLYVRINGATVGPLS